MTGNGGSHSYCIYISFLDPKTLDSDKKVFNYIKLFIYIFNL